MLVGAVCTSVLSESAQGGLTRCSVRAMGHGLKAVSVKSQKPYWSRITLSDLAYIWLL